MRPPDRQHVRRVPAADVDDVLLAEEGPDVVDSPIEQPEVRRLRPPSEERVEGRDVLVVVAAGGADEADSRPLQPGKIQ